MSAVEQCNGKDIEKAWYSSFGNIEGIVDKITYETIIKNIKPVIKSHDTLELSMSKTWQRDHLVKFIDPISEILRKEAGKNIKITMSVRPEIEDEIMENHTVKLVSPSMSVQADENICSIIKNADEDQSLICLNPKYTFDNYIVGSGNRFAAAAAKAVAEAPANAYNPLFIYGGAGLGKTHLINAIGNLVIKNKPKAKVVYVSAEKFTNDMIESIGDKKMKQFRRKYRNVDVLLIDDIHFIKNKEAIQEEFFHTFNELHAAKAQIVITSDRPPKDIPTLEDRLRSRFMMGLITDISPPDLETRIAILKKKTDRDNVKAPNEVLSYIAEKIPSNIRELEGALNRVICYASLLNQPINLDLALNALKNIIPDSHPKHLTISFIQEKVCEYYNIRIDEMLGKCRDSRLVLPRQIAMYLSKELLGASFPNIGTSFGGRDHTTVMHAYNKIQKHKRDASIKNDIENIKNMLKNPGG